MMSQQSDLHAQKSRLICKVDKIGQRQPADEMQFSDFAFDHPSPSAHAGWQETSMTDEERLEFERLKARVAELEARPVDAAAFEAAIKGSAAEKLARLELASLPPGWDDEHARRKVSRVSFAIGTVVTTGMLIFFALHTFLGWPA